MNKAQVKMFETVAILIVFFFLLIFGVSFYTLMQKSGIEKEAEKNIQLKSITIAQKTAYLPELDCAIVGIQIDNCFDVHKVLAFKEVLNDQSNMFAYFPVLEYSKIHIESIYPNDKINITIYDQTGNRTRKIPTFYPVVLYNATSNAFNFAVLEVSVYGT